MEDKEIYFTVWCFGARRWAVGHIQPHYCQKTRKEGRKKISELALSGYEVPYQVALPPIDRIDSFYHRCYPADGIHRGTMLLDDEHLRALEQQHRAILDTIRVVWIDAVNRNKRLDILDFSHPYSRPVEIPRYENNSVG